MMPLAYPRCSFQSGGCKNFIVYFPIKIESPGMPHDMLRSLNQPIRKPLAARISHHDCVRSANRCNLPVSVRGRLSTKAMARGYLYGAIVALTWSCSVLTMASSPEKPGLSTTKGLTTPTLLESANQTHRTENEREGKEG